jgi:hypothetical protein
VGSADKPQPSRGDARLNLPGELGQAKVGEDRLGDGVLGPEEDVLGLEVAVDDAGLVDGLEGVGELAREDGGVLLRVVSGRDDGVEELAAAAELRHDGQAGQARRRGDVLVRGHELEHVGVVELPDALEDEDLVEGGEALLQRRVRLGQDHLHRDGLAGRLHLARPHDGEPALPELVADVADGRDAEEGERGREGGERGRVTPRVPCRRARASLALHGAEPGPLTRWASGTPSPWQ